MKKIFFLMVFMLLGFLLFSQTDDGHARCQSPNFMVSLCATYAICSGISNICVNLIKLYPFLLTQRRKGAELLFENLFFKNRNSIDLMYFLNF